MPDVIEPPRITATPAACSAIVRLRAAVGGPVMFVQSAGCCAGSTPMCFRDGEFLVGDGDIRLGEVAGAPFYIDARLDTAWGSDTLVLDVAPGPPEGFSFGAGEGQHFVTHSSSCPALFTSIRSPQADGGTSAAGTTSR